MFLLVWPVSGTASPRDAARVNRSSVILFGAGASYGSDDVVPHVPPLTRGLMTALSIAAPESWGCLPNDVRAIFEGDFERGMTELGHTQPDLLPTLQRSMARFFFDFLPGPENLYRKLGRRIRAAQWDGALATLNYERLLQLSLEAEGVEPIYGVPEWNCSSVEVCVPHGACHIFCDVLSAAANGVEFAGTAVATGGRSIVVNDPGEFRRHIEGDAFPPVMSYFDPRKDTTSCVNFILRQRARFKELVAKADSVVIVGVAVRPEDHHVWGPLAESPTKLAFCAGASAAEVFEEWAGSNRRGRLNRAYPTYISESFNELCGLVGL